LAVHCNTQTRELAGIEPFEDSDRRANRVCAMSRAGRGGKYQDQAGLTLSGVD
jgi:hypothetical protein